MWRGLPGSGKSTAAAKIAGTLREKGRPVVCVDENEPNHPADDAEYDFPDFETGRERILARWRSFAESARRDAAYGFDGIFLQNPMCETMMRFGMGEGAFGEYIGEIAEIIRMLGPVVIYIDLPGGKAAIDRVREERKRRLDIGSHVVTRDMPGSIRI